MYIISLPLHGQVELYFDLQMNPSQASKGIFFSNLVAGSLS
jgi:hypothetical protein